MSNRSWSLKTLVSGLEVSDGITFHLVGRDIVISLFISRFQATCANIESYKDRHQLMAMWNVLIL